MPLIGALLGAVSSFMGTWVFSVLMALGISFLSFKGVDVVVSTLKDQVVAGTIGLPIDMLNMIGYLWLDKAIGLIISAYAAAFHLWYGLSGFKHMVFKK